MFCNDPKQAVKLLKFTHSKLQTAILLCPSQLLHKCDIYLDQILTHLKADMISDINIKKMMDDLLRNIVEIKQMI